LSAVRSALPRSSLRLPRTDITLDDRAFLASNSYMEPR
jgi:hypothetical protein